MRADARSSTQAPIGGKLGLAPGQASAPEGQHGVTIGADAQGQVQRRHQLGWFLCWAVVFADIGTSVYYTPGILYQTPGVGIHAALFVSMTMVAFLLLSIKYAEVTIRYPEGGGVVTVGTRALHPFVGLLGGMFILVDYFLTAAISVDSGIVYLSAVIKSLAPIVVPVSLVTLAILGLLNWIGIRESARVSAVFALLAFAGQLLVLIALVIHVPFHTLMAAFPKTLSGPRLTPLGLLTGYAGAFLAFSGLESISQLSPVMAEPRRRVARLAMGVVVISIALTSPLLTLWSTTVLPITPRTDPNQFISLLGGYAAGRWLEWPVAISGALLLVFASNTAIIGSYHVFLALGRMRFFPEAIERRNRLRGTPHWAILLAVGVPLIVLALVAGNLTLLGDLYAFGLLGAFSVTCLSLDVVRWREQHFLRLPAVALKTPARKRVARRVLLRRANFALGALTTVLVLLAWSTNLVNKPLATLFGGSVATFGLLVALVNYRLLDKRGRPVVFPSVIRGAVPDAVLAVLSGQPATTDALIRAASLAAEGRPVVFVYRGVGDGAARPPRLFEVIDPYLEDRAAQDAFSRAEKLGRKLDLDRRFVYVPAHDGASAVTRLWQTIRPRDTLVAAGGEDALHDVAPDRVRRPAGGAAPIAHYVKHWEPNTLGS